MTRYTQLQLAADENVVYELVTNGFLVHATERYQRDIEPYLRPVDSHRFEMGTESSRERHFCGEIPRHAVDLSRFMLSEFAVTNDLFALLDPRRLEVPKADKATPVVDVTWFDAAVFSKWVGCRLPTEAEWAFACGVGTIGEWCRVEANLPHYAWYGENADGHIHTVGTRERNSLGFFDMHGNVWEWRQDSYFADYYARSPLRDPVNDDFVASPICFALQIPGRSFKFSFLTVSEIDRKRSTPEARPLDHRRLSCPDRPAQCTESNHPGQKLPSGRWRVTVPTGGGDGVR